MRKWVERIFRYAATILTLSVMGCLWAQHTVNNAVCFLVDVASCVGIWTVWVRDNFKYEVEIYHGETLIYQKSSCPRNSNRVLLICSYKQEQHEWRMCDD